MEATDGPVGARPGVQDTCGKPEEMELGSIVRPTWHAIQVPLPRKNAIFPSRSWTLDGGSLLIRLPLHGPWDQKAHIWHCTKHCPVSDVGKESNQPSSSSRDTGKGKRRRRSKHARRLLTHSLTPRDPSG